MHNTYEWDIDDDLYNREKYGYHPNDELRDEFEEIASLIRKEVTNDRLSVYVNIYTQIVVQLNLNNVEKMYSIMEGMEELNDIRLKHLSDFETSNFEICMEKNNPVIYCTYERV